MYRTSYGGFSHDQQIAQAAQLQQQLADPSGTGNPTLHSMYSMVPRCDICGFTDGLNSSSVIEHIRKVHCAERDDQIRAQDQLIQQQSNKIEHSKSVQGSGGGVNANGRKHHPLSNKSKRPFVCPTCSKGFAQKIHLETHLKNVHLKDKPYKCSFCEYSCANKGMLDKHVRIVHNKERPFKCQLCGSSFGQKVHLDAHVNAVHIQAKPFKCEACVYCATTKGLLDKHFRTVHQKEKPFACDVCHSRFGQKAHLNKHILTVHKKEKPYKCQDCDYQGSTKTNLNKHVSLVHLKEKPYSCLLCPDAKFGQKSHLDNHMRQVHGGNIVTVALAPPVSTTSQDIYTKTPVDTSGLDPLHESSPTSFVVFRDQGCGPEEGPSVSPAHHMPSTSSAAAVAAAAAAILSDLPDVSTSSDNDGVHKCLQCNETFSTSNNLRIHVVTVHDPAALSPPPSAGTHFLTEPLFQLT